MVSNVRGFALVALVVALSSPALADPTAQEKETARNLMDEGRELRDDKKDPKSALARFKAADAIMHVPTTSIEVAATEVSLGLLVEAREVIAKILATQVQKGEPIQFKDARKRAQTLDDEIAAKIPTIVVTLKNGSGASVLIDNDALPPSLVGLPARANPGHHVIIASTKSMEGRTEVDLAEGEKKEVTITLESRGVEHENIAHETQPPVETPAASHGSTARTLGFIMFGVGGASLIAGGITGVLTFTAQSDLSTKCPNHICGPESHDELSMASTTGLVSTITFIAAGVFVTTGIVAVLLGKPKNTEAKTAHVTPWIGPGSAGLVGSF